MWVSHLALGSSWDFVGVCYGTLLLLSDLTPTIGPWQPVFVALFPRFRSLFLLAVHGHVISYLIPLGLRFRYGVVGSTSTAALQGLTDSGIVLCWRAPPRGRENALYMASLIVLLTSLLKTCALLSLPSVPIVLCTRAAADSGQAVLGTSQGGACFDCALTRCARYSMRTWQISLHC
eukprot:COSAG02_NODE_3044_length_7482_cov_3.060680_2_plen_177_part_00